jgi:hypothetical protein
LSLGKDVILVNEPGIRLRRDRYMMEYIIQWIIAIPAVPIMGDK